MLFVCLFVCLSATIMVNKDEYISLGSVATHLRCGGIFNDDIIVNFLPILTVNKFVNQLIYDKVIRHTKIVPFFGGHPVGYKRKLIG